MKQGTLAHKNLKYHKKQYIIMSAGIVLALFFVMSIALYFFSEYEITQKKYIENFGSQSFIISMDGYSQSTYDNAVEAGAICDYGTAEILGAIYTTDENVYVSAAKADKKAISLSNLTMLSGSYPKNAGEIAIEETQLSRLDIDAKPGDKITLNLMIQNGSDYAKTVKKTYTLTGIVKDKLVNINIITEAYGYIPGAFFSDKEEIQAGGKERVTAYCSVSDSKNSIDTKAVYEANLYFYDLCDSQGVYEFDYNPNDMAGFSNIFADGYNTYVFIIAAALVISCVVMIANAFDSNLKDRKKQIGLLRAVGTTKRQVMQLFARESFIIALVCVLPAAASAYAAVSAILYLSDAGSSVTKNPAVFLGGAAAGTAIIMLASLIPLAKATRISPMQAIRDIEKTRRMKNKKFKSKKSFNASLLIAKRNIGFSKFSAIGLNVFLTVVIVFSCTAFSYVKSDSQNLYTYYSDYMIEFGMINNEYNSQIYSGFDEDSVSGVKSTPYLSQVQTQKKICAYADIDGFSDYLKSIPFVVNFAFSNPDGEITAQNYTEKYTAQKSDSYTELQKNIGASSDIVKLNITSANDSVIDELKSLKYDGEIDSASLSSGDEVILIAPKTAVCGVHFYSEASKTEPFAELFSDGETMSDSYEKVCSGSCPYKVGDEIKITIPVGKYNNDEEVSDIKLTKKTVRIAAIISPTQLDGTMFESSEFELLTTNSAVNNILPGADYCEIYAFAIGSIDDSKDEIITASLEKYANMHSGGVVSQYSIREQQRNDNKSMFFSVIALVLICFCITIASVNNAISARLKENRKEIGTLRAFGADTIMLTRAYMLQTAYMILPGIAAGSIVFSLGFATVYLVLKNNVDSDYSLVFDPWITVVFCAVMTAICFVTLYLKIRKRVKSSIIEDIRE